MRHMLPSPPHTQYTYSFKGNWKTLTNGSPAGQPNSFRKNCITAWNRFRAEILYMFCFIIGAFPTPLNRTMTFDISQYSNQTKGKQSEQLLLVSFFLYVSSAFKTSSLIVGTPTSRDDTALAVVGSDPGVDIWDCLRDWSRRSVKA